MNPQEPSVTPEEIEAYLQGSIASPETLRRIEAHLEQSDQARANLLNRMDARQIAAGLQQTRNRAALEDQSLPDELVLSYVMGTATPSERAMAETLATDSARDQEAIDSLAQFHEQMQRYDWRTLKQVAEGKSRKPAAQAQNGWERRGRAGLFGSSPVMAGAFCSLLVITLLNTWLLLHPAPQNEAQAKGGISLPVTVPPELSASASASEKEKLYAPRGAAEYKPRLAYLLFAALELARKQMGPDSRDTAACYYHLGRFYLANGRQAEAWQNLQNALSLFQKQQMQGSSEYDDINRLLSSLPEEPISPGNSNSPEKK